MRMWPDDVHDGAELWGKYAIDFERAKLFGQVESPRGKKCRKCGKYHYGVCAALEGEK